MKVAICDDEEKCRKIVLEYLTPYMQENDSIAYEEFDCGEELLLSFERGVFFDVVFLDIEMPGENGVEIAKQIQAIESNVAVIFITNHGSYVREAFRIKAFQFLEKPIQKEDFDLDFSRVQEEYKITHFAYTIKCKGSIEQFEIKDIHFIERYGGSLFLHAGGEKINFFGKFAKEEEKLRHYYFICCHQGFLINMSYIKRIGKKEILLKTGEEIPLSKHRRETVLSGFNEYSARFGI